MKSILDLIAEKEELQKRALELISNTEKEERKLNDEENSQLEEIKKQISDKEDEIRKMNNNNNNLIKQNNSIEKRMEKKEFRLLKAINDIANNRQLDETSQAVAAAGAEEMRHAGLSFGGQLQLPIEKRDAVSVTSTDGSTVAVDVVDILAPLRAKSVLLAAGAKYMTGLVGDVKIPIMTANNVSWEGETASAKDGAGTISNVVLQPKRLTCYVDVSKQFLVQDSVDAEKMIEQDIVNAISAKLEATILGKEEGSNTKPAGMFNGNTPTTVSTFADLANLEATVEDANVTGQIAYVASNKAKAAMRALTYNKNTRTVYENGEVDGTPLYATSNVESNNFIVGDFSNLAIGQWGVVDLTIDPYSKAADGLVRIVVNAYFDAKVLRSNAFAYGTFTKA